MGKGYREKPRQYEAEEQHSYTAKAERVPLQWRELHVIKAGNVQAAISEATNDRGEKLFSFALGRVLFEGRTSKFFQPRDVENIGLVVTGVQQWLAAQAPEKEPG